MKKKNKKVNAAILIIGDEILSGRTQESNVSFISKWLNDSCGILVEEVRVIPDIEKKIISILDSKIRPAVARDGGDIKFQEFKDGKVKVLLKGSCSGCPSSTLTLKKGVENLLCHYIPEVKEVLAV